MSSPRAGSIFSSSSSSGTDPSRPTSPTTLLPDGGDRHHRRHRRHRPTALPTGTITDAIDSPPTYLNHPFQPEQQASIHNVSGSPSMHRRSQPGLFYGLHGLNLSSTSLESNALLDHRDQKYMRPRRASTAGGPGNPAFGGRKYAGSYFGEASERAQTEEVGVGCSSAMRPADINVTTPGGSQSAARQKARSLYRERLQKHPDSEGSEGSGNDTESTRLLRRRRSRGSQRAHERTIFDIPRGQASEAPQPAGLSVPGTQRDYGSTNVNFPPSVPSSPRVDLPLYLDGANAVTNIAGEMQGHRRTGTGDTIIVIDREPGTDNLMPQSSPPTPSDIGPGARQATLRAEEDVCFPVDECLSEHDVLPTGRVGRRGPREWPELNVLEEWSREEKEQRSEGIRAKKTAEPVYVGGRLRPNLRAQWHREEEEAPYRFTYFNDELPATIHSHTISELIQPGQTFKDLFRPDPRTPSEYSDDDEPESSHGPLGVSNNNGSGGNGRTPPHTSTMIGTRPTFWLDVLSPTDAEMKTLSKAFGIHPLTAEDIMMQEAREKVELFRSYYLVSYKSFEQDMNSEDYLEPVNIYVVVFREGVISFHFSMTPHPANVRRRIRQLKDYITVSADWISYAIIDDITDAFAPLIQGIEDEVDDIDEQILRLHVSPLTTSMWKSEKKTDGGEEGESDGNMLRRVGDCRKKVMGLYRLLGNKADVIKGFAKRCNEQWEVAPRSEIGLYLGDIQDHIVTMVSNLNHYEKILSRSHSNYLAQINIKMNQRQEETADVLGRLTVLGTIVLPMNIITGLWGMNVLVPGQDVDNLNWFWCIAGSLLLFGFLCYIIAKRVYKIV